MPTSADNMESNRPWLVDGACRGVDPDLFFPERGGDTDTPKQICKGCPVRAECAEYAIAKPEKYGIWGGLSERERRAIRRRRQTRRAA